METESENDPKKYARKRKPDQFPMEWLPDKLSDLLRSGSVFVNFEPPVFETHQAQLQFLKLASRIADLVAVEEQASGMIREIAKAIHSPHTVLEFVVENERKIEAKCNEAEKLWREFSLDAIVDGLFTVNNLAVPWVIIGDSKLPYHKLYIRIAEEMRRQRDMLQSFYLVQRKTAELDPLVEEFLAICSFAKRIHKRLCLLEKTASNVIDLDCWADQLIAELRLDHGAMDDALISTGTLTTQMNAGMASRCRPVVEPTKKSPHHCKLKHQGWCGMSAVGACKFVGAV